MFETGMFLFGLALAQEICGGRGEGGEQFGYC